MLILASKSPRRAELLRTIYNGPFEIDPSGVDESQAVYDDLSQAPLAIARLKISAAFKNHPSDTVLAADTVVLQAGSLFGKPHDKDEALAMLKSLVKADHRVLTGYVIGQYGKIVSSGTVETTLRLGFMSETEILRYIETGSPFDKAGGYGIQDSEYITVESIEGSLSNVMGLPTEKISEELQKLGL